MRWKISILFVVSFLMAATCSLVWAGLSMPELLKSEFTQYPGSTVVDTTDSMMIKQVVLDCGDATQQEIYDYYKAKATKGGWKIQLERKTAKKWHLMISNDKWNGNIAVAGKDGKSTVTLTLMVLRKG